MSNSIVMMPPDRRKWIRDNVGTDEADFTPEILQKIADSPIMDPLRIYLPAGEVSEEEYRRRASRILTDGRER